MACKGHGYYFLDLQTHSWTQAASARCGLCTARYGNPFTFYFSVKNVSFKKKKKKADHMAKNTKDFTFNKNSVSLKRHI